MSIIAWIVPVRRVGTALTWFGAVGLLLTTVMTMAWLGGLVAMRDLDERLEDDRRATAASLLDASTLLGSTATVLEGTTMSLGTAGTALYDTAQLLDQLAESTRQLADALDVSFFGQRPFAQVATTFEDITDDLTTAATDVGFLATDVEELEPDVQNVAAHLRVVEASVRVLAARVTAFRGVEELVGLARAYALLSAMLSAWLAALAVGCVWLGRQLRSAADTVTADPPPTG